MRRRLHIWLLLPAILLFFYLALDSALGDSPTMDEQNHMARGLAFLRTGDPRLSLEHPPLINSISALPLLTLQGVRLPTDHPSWERPEGWYEFADLFLWEYNHDVTRMVFLARLPIMILTLALAVVAYRFALELWQPAAGLLAFLLILFDPNILAHGRYSTTDLGVTLFVFLATFLLWRVWRHQEYGWRRVPVAGLGLGLAFASKLSALTFIPGFALLAILPLYGEGWHLRSAARRLLQLATAGLFSLLVVWVCYGLEIGPVKADSSPLSLISGITVPMPTFWSGIDQILALSSGGRLSFLLGRTSTEGFLAYFPVAFLVKTPLATLLALVLTLVLTLHPRLGRSLRSKAFFLLLPPSIYFLITLQSGLNLGYRHLLPMLPFLYVFIGGVLASLSARQSRLTAGSFSWRPLVPLLVPLALLLTTLSIHPHYLSYFNLFAGGPENGYNVLIDSNVDWGQDLLRLQEWMEEHGVERVRLAWFGSARPEYYGIAYDPLPGLPHHFDLWWDPPFDPSDPSPGIYAISVSNLWELPLQDEKYVFPWFRARVPDDRVGYSILIYEVD